MTLSLPVVWDDRCLLHDAGGASWIGIRRAKSDEVPERLEIVRSTLQAAGARIVPAEPHDDETLRKVHDERFLAFLQDAHVGWTEAGYADEGQEKVVGYIFATAELLGGAEPIEPTKTAARTGRYAFDTATVIGPQTWTAVRAAADASLTAADLVLAGERVTYACVRPPGHHATRAGYGGSCFLNNGAIAAQRLRDGGADVVAIVDVDAHHGNGAQAIFWSRADVVTASVHVDPEAGWFPYFLGLAREAGAGEGSGGNLNIPLPPGTGDDDWVAAVERATAFAAAAGAEALVVPLGVDAVAEDPHSPLLVTADGYRRAGHALGRLGLPTVVVQEGGYDLVTIGRIVHALLRGIEEAG